MGFDGRRGTRRGRARATPDMVGQVVPGDRVALGQGARGVVWVTLRETRGIYHATNVAIRAAARRWPQLVVADWNAYSSGRLWFGDDGLHLTNAGASGLAAFLRPFVLKAAGLRSS